MSNKAEPDYILSLEFGTIPVVWYFFFDFHLPSNCHFI